MKIYRGPRTTNHWKVTDTKPAADWAEEWKPGKKVRLDGTIQKGGQRHTDLGVEIEADDIIALSKALMHAQKSRIADYESETEEQSKTIDLLETVLRKIERLVSSHRDKAPSQKKLLETIREIAEHFAWNYTRTEPMKLKWIDWDSI